MSNYDLRRDYSLPEEDTDFLNSLALPWETIRDNGNMWLIIHNYPIPKGYKTQVGDVAIQISGNYPMSPLDMVYFNPALFRMDDKPVLATETMINISGSPFQRWSRHSTSQNPWRVGLDNISSHLSLVEEWLAREFKIR